MIDKVKKTDGTIVDFDLVKTINSISQTLQGQSDLTVAESDEIAKNIIELISEKFISSIPSTKDFELLVDLVLRANKEEAQNEAAENTAAQEDNEFSAVAPSQVEEEENKDIKHLEEMGVYLTDHAKRILTESTIFDDLGRLIFLDRYSVKEKRESILKGDLVVAISKENPKYPKKDLGIVKERDGDSLVLHMITGMFADKANNYELTVSILKCDKPLESIKDSHKRIARAIASVEETPQLQEKWAGEFLKQLQKKHIQPAGRIMTGASMGEDAYTKNLTLFNCYVLPSPKDSRGGIVKETLYQMTEIFSRGGGVGINLSTLRPRYAYVQGVHGKSSGAVSWGGIYSYGTGLIEQGGSRRGALMLML